MKEAHDFVGDGRTAKKVIVVVAEMQPGLTAIDYEYAERTIKDYLDTNHPELYYEFNFSVGEKRVVGMTEAVTKSRKKVESIRRDINLILDDCL